MDMVPEEDFVDLLKSAAPLQFFQLSAMSVNEKMALKKRLTVELAHVRSTAQSIESECERKLGQMFPSVMEDVLKVSRDGGCGFDRQLSLTSQSSRTTCGKINQQLFTKSEYVSGDVEMMRADKSEMRPVVTAGGAKCGSPLQRPGRRQRMDGDRMKQCASILQKLMTHESGWLFNQPVDPVKLNIPDYFSIISRPMDLGTIKSKLERKMYSDTEEFAIDVRLTFSNAMRYNPPRNEVHILAKALKNIFNRRWKPLEANWRGDRGTAVKKKALPKQAYKQPKRSDDQFKRSAYCLSLVPRRRAMTSADKQRLRKDLAKILDGCNVPPQLLSLLRRFGSLGQKEDGIEVDINAFDDDTSWKLHRIIRSFLVARSAKAAADMSDDGPGRNNLFTDIMGGGGLDGHADNGMPLQGPAACINGMCGSLKCRVCRSHGGDFTTQASSTDLDSSRSSKPLPPDSSQTAAAIAMELRDHSDPDTDDANTAEAASVGDEETDRPFLHHAPADDSSGQGEGELLADGQLSPSKALRAAILMGRFAETIFKAQQKTLLNQGVKVDPIKLQRQKEELERRQQEERARLEAQVRAAEAARERAEAEAREKREMEREAARVALQNMEKTVDINENSEILKDLEMLGYSSHLPPILSSSPGDGVETPAGEGIVVFPILQGGGNPLEQLGLFMKDDDIEDEDEVAEATTMTIDWPAANNGDADVEEGEIGP